jgi:hypothetical protein
MLGFLIRHCTSSFLRSFGWYFASHEILLFVGFHCSLSINFASGEIGVVLPLKSEHSSREPLKNLSFPRKRESTKFVECWLGHGRRPPAPGCRRVRPRHTREKRLCM